MVHFHAPRPLAIGKGWLPAPFKGGSLALQDEVIDRWLGHVGLLGDHPQDEAVGVQAGLGVDVVDGDIGPSERHSNEGCNVRVVWSLLLTKRVAEAAVAR
jgi:hypothetical protein